MKKYFSGYMVGLYVAITLLVGIDIVKVFESQAILTNPYVQVFTVLLLFVLCIICYIAGWSNGSRHEK